MTRSPDGAESGGAEEVELTTLAELDEVVGRPLPRVRDKVRSRLDAMDAAFLSASPFCVLGTTGADGSVTVTPRGDPPGLLHVVDASAPWCCPTGRATVASTPGTTCSPRPQVGLLARTGRGSPSS